MNQYKHTSKVVLLSKPLPFFIQINDLYLLYISSSFVSLEAITNLQPIEHSDKLINFITYYNKAKQAMRCEYVYSYAIAINN